MAEMSKLEAKFARYWKLLGGPPIEHNYRFMPGRRFHIDFAHVETRTGFEIEGGIWMRPRASKRTGRLSQWGGGGHNHPLAIETNMAKRNEAEFLGWHVFQVPEKMLRADWVERAIAFCVSRSHAQRAASGDSQTDAMPPMASERPSLALASARGTPCFSMKSAIASRSPADSSSPATAQALQKRSRSHS